MSTEARLQAKVTAYCKKIGVIAYKIDAASRRGVPDLLLRFDNNIAIHIETKHPSGTGRLAKLQEHEIKRLRSKGAHVYVSQDYDEIKSIIDRYVDLAAAEGD